ncbi:MAG: hypothetical protein RLZZ142_1162 [Verrucomicrobiota bacterium]
MKSVFPKTDWRGPSSARAWLGLGWAVLIWAAGFSAAQTAEITPEQRAFFENKIRPVLVKECYECHSEDSKKLGGRLKLDSHFSMMKGGESGPAMQPGKPDKSILIQAIQYDGSEMPPKKKLPDHVIRDFVEWVKMGAPDPRTEPMGAKAKEPGASRNLDWWSLKPVVDPQIPSAEEGGDWAKDPLDRLVLQKMRSGGLHPAADADPAALLRRLSVDLTGLPPAAEQVEQFVVEHRREGREALARWVDRLLASPQYGERWGRHWLDVARFAESNGDDGLGRNPNFPHAWRYRDYVIDAFNRDVPYDVFLREQIAGDLMGDLPGPERDRRLVATGFLAVGYKPCIAMNNNFAMDVVADQIGLIGSGVLGLSVGCARCHDHKHDPITLRDYTALAGIFKSTDTLWGAAGYEPLSAPQTPLHELTAAPWVAVPAAEALPKVVRQEHKRPTKGKFDPAPGAPVAMGVREAAEIADIRVHIGGEAGRLGDLVPRGVPGLFRTEALANVSLCPPRSGRMELVDWLVGEALPLTSRVMVNRVWQHLFEEGLVRTPDDFGVYGDQPVQRELLDHLAARFVREGWSVKKLVRAMVMSRTYQMASAPSEAARFTDPENRLLSFHPRRRMDGEALRDAMLAASGELKLERPAGSLLQHQNVLVNEMGDLHRTSPHRSVYQLMLRGAMPPELSVFNEPDALKVKGKRDMSTVPTQFLYLLNNPFVVEQSRRFAERVLAAGGSDSDAVGLVYRRAFSRNPSDSERQEALGFLADMERELEAAEPDHARRRGSVWAALCQSLLASNPMRYVD